MTSQQRKKNVFIVISHIKQLKDGKWNVVEQCEFVDSLKKRHITATVVIDYLKEEFVSNREGKGTYKEFMWYLHKNYPKQMTELSTEYKTDKV